MNTQTVRRPFDADQSWCRLLETSHLFVFTNFIHADLVEIGFKGTRLLDCWSPAKEEEEEDEQEITSTVNIDLTISWGFPFDVPGLSLPPHCAERYFRAPWFAGVVQRCQHPRTTITHTQARTYNQACTAAFENASYCVHLYRHACCWTKNHLLREESVFYDQSLVLFAINVGGLLEWSIGIRKVNFYLIQWKCLKVCRQEREQLPSGD